jgi:dihydroorotase/N-acyl-D-amino-acid deacylase
MNVDSFRPIVLAAAILAAMLPHSASAQIDFSVIIEGGLVADGTGRALFRADVGLRGDRIEAVGDLAGEPAAVRVDATGLVVAPGFIDIHSHADGSLARLPLAENYVRQGVTSVFGGQDGDSPLDLGTFLGGFDLEPAAVNLGMFVGHGSVRERVVGLDDRPATGAELEEMARLVDRAMRDGAFGLSSGLEYTPGRFASTGELVALAAATARYRGLYISHVRDEGGRLEESVREVIRIAEQGRVAGQLTHHKIIGKDRWGGTERSLALVDEARSRGVDVTLDVYPYTASSTGMTILFPAWAQDGGFEALQARLRDPADRERIRGDVIRHLVAERGADPSTVVASLCTWDSTRNGKSLADMARESGREATVETAADIAIELVEGGNCQGVFHSMSEDDVRRVMAHPFAMIASDGGVPEPGRGMPHPRSYGTFARVLARYVRELGTLTLPDAVRRMTYAPAARLGLRDRGVIRPGAVADVTVFDAGTIRDEATFGDPHRYATGVRHVFVAGRWTLRDGEPTGVRAGRTLRRGR